MGNQNGKPKLKILRAANKEESPRKLKKEKDKDRDKDVEKDPDKEKDKDNKDKEKEKDIKGKRRMMEDDHDGGGGGDSDDEDDEENDELGDEQEFTPSSHSADTDISPFSYSDKIEVIAKQDLIHLQVEFVISVKEMCDVSFPVAVTLLHYCKWDKDKLVEKWIEDSEKMCSESGVVYPVISAKLDATIPASLFAPFPLEEEPRRTPRAINPLLSSTLLPLPPRSALGGNVRLLDIIRPLLARRNGSLEGREEADEDDQPRQFINLDEPTVPEITAMHMSLVSQVQDVFPELDEPFISLCLRVFQNNYERIVDSILEGSLPPPLAQRLAQIRSAPSIPSVASEGSERSAGRGSSLAIESVGSSSSRRRDSSSSDSSTNSDTMLRSTSSGRITHNGLSNEDLRILDMISSANGSNGRAAPHPNNYRHNRTGSQGSRNSSIAPASPSSSARGGANNNGSRSSRTRGRKTKKNKVRDASRGPLDDSDIHLAISQLQQESTALTTPIASYELSAASSILSNSSSRTSLSTPTTPSTPSFPWVSSSSFSPFHAPSTLSRSATVSTTTTTTTTSHAPHSPPTFRTRPVSLTLRAPRSPVAELEARTRAEEAALKTENSEGSLTANLETTNRENSTFTDVDNDTYTYTYTHGEGGDLETTGRSESEGWSEEEEILVPKRLKGMIKARERDGSEKEKKEAEDSREGATGGEVNGSMALSGSKNGIRNGILASSQSGVQRDGDGVQYSVQFAELHVSGDSVQASESDFGVTESGELMERTASNASEIDMMNNEEGTTTTTTTTATNDYENENEDEEGEEEAANEEEQDTPLEHKEKQNQDNRMDENVDGDNTDFKELKAMVDEFISENLEASSVQFSFAENNTKEEEQFTTTTTTTTTTSTTALTTTEETQDVDNTSGDNNGNNDDGASKEVVPAIAKEVQEEQEDDGAEKVTCQVCFDDFSLSKVYQLACGHQYCMECWDNYLTTKLSEGFPGALSATCINPKCKIVVDICSWRKLVSETKFLRYQWFLLKAFVDNSPKTMWCASPQGCGYAAYFTGVDIPSVVEVKCKCGYKFCFHCGEEAHQPVTCKQIAGWQMMRTGEEGQNALWLSQNTKRCPNCKVHIEKNDGCMHMICKICYHEFCWLCKGNWAEHGDKTGGYYSCNRYDPLKHDTPDLDLRFGKYVHHFQRFTYHTNARKMAENRGAEIKLREPPQEPGEDPWDRAFLYDVLDLALTCRHVLKYTYVFGFFLEDGKEKELFEFLQEDLEKSTEHLTELLFRELDCIAAPIVSPADIIHIRNYTKVTRKFLESLISGLHNGLTSDYGPPSPEDINKKGKKKITKDKKKKSISMVWKKDRSKTNL